MTSPFLIHSLGVSQTPNYYIIQKGKMEEGKLLPPSNWESTFTGSAWERIGDSNEFYLHLFCREQADLNWENPEVRREIIDILNFWLDKGVDWMIRKDYLQVEYDYRLPVIIYSPIGWEIEKKQYALELYQTICNAAKAGDEAIIEKLKEHTNRQVVLILLELIEERGDPSLIPFLEKWREIEVKKLKSRIGSLIKAISERQTTQ